MSKAAFMARCRDEGVSASEAVRRFIDREIDGTPLSRSTRLRLWHALAAAMVGALVGGVAGPSLAHSLPTQSALFERLDRNHDGVLSFEEFRRR